MNIELNTVAHVGMPPEFAHTSWPPWMTSWWVRQWVSANGIDPYLTTS